MHRTVALRTHQPPIDCNTMLGVGVVPFTMESLGAYLFAGAFRFFGAPHVLAVKPENAPTTLNVLMQKRGK